MLTDDVVAIAILDKHHQGTFASLILLDHFHHDLPSLIVCPKDQALFHDIAGKFVLGECKKLCFDVCDDLCAIPGIAVLDDVLGDIISILVRN